jgi:Transmembrane secretion effector
VQARGIAESELSGTPSRLSSALGHRDFALLWSGQTVSMAGDGIFTVALAVETLRVDSHPLALAIVLAARLVPTVLLLLLGGVVVDRVPRRLAMLASDVVRGAAVVTISILIAQRSLDLGGLLVMSAIFGVADAFFSPASTAVVPEVLPAELLVQASALSSMSRVFARQLLGPALGGVLVAAVGTAWSFGLDGASFAVRPPAFSRWPPVPALLPPVARFWLTSARALATAAPNLGCGPRSPAPVWPTSPSGHRLGC